MVHVLRGGLEIGRLGEKYVIDKFLRVPIVEREPAALHLDHYPMTLEKHMIVAMQIDRVFGDAVCDERFWIFKAREIPAAKYLAGDHELVAGHFRSVLRVFVD